MRKLFLRVYGFYYSIKIKFMSYEAIKKSIRKDCHIKEAK